MNDETVCFCFASPLSQLPPASGGLQTLFTSDFNLTAFTALISFNPTNMR